MRYLLAILICALGADAALALPASNRDALGMSADNSVVQIAKRGGGKQQAKKSKNSGGDGGIHPLVGSGGY